MADRTNKRDNNILSPLSSPEKQHIRPMHPKNPQLRIRVKDGIPVSIVAPALFPASYSGLPECLPNASFNDSTSVNLLPIEEQLAQAEGTSD